MTAPMDAERLRAALRWLHLAHTHSRPNFDDEQRAVIRAAAEAQLALLPRTKTRWRVTGEGPKIRQTESFSTRDAAGKFASYLVETGFDHITIHVEQVPG